MLFREREFGERESVDPTIARRRVGESLARLSSRIAQLPAARRIGFQQVVEQAKGAMAELHVEFAEALASVLEVAVGEAEDDQRRRTLSPHR